MGIFSSCMSNNKKKNEIEKMKEIRDKARDKANELQMQQNQLAEEIKQRKRKAIDLKYNKEDESVIRSALKEIKRSKMKFENLEKFKSRYEENEDMLDKMINTIGAMEITEITTQLIKKCLKETQNMEDILAENKDVQNEIADIDNILDDDIDASDCEFELAKDAVKEAIDYLRNNYWTFVKDFSKDICKAFEGEFDLHYVVKNEYTTIASILTILEEKLPSILNNSLIQFERNIEQNNSFLVEGGMDVITRSVSTVVMDWIKQHVLEVVEMTVKNEMDRVSLKVFERIASDNQDIKTAFQASLQKMKVEVNKIFERKWTEMINQGAIKAELVTKLNLTYPYIQTELNRLSGVTESTASMNQSTSSPLPSVPTHPVLPSVPTTEVSISSRNQTSPVLVAE